MKGRYWEPESPSFQQHCSSGKVSDWLLPINPFSKMVPTQQTLKFFLIVEKYTQYKIYLFLILYTFYFIFYYIFFTVVQVQLSPFSPHHSPTHPRLPPYDPTPLWLCPCVLYTCSLMALPLLSPTIPLSPSSLVTVCLFFTSKIYYLKMYSPVISSILTVWIHPCMACASITFPTGTLHPSNTNSPVLSAAPASSTLLFISMNLSGIISLCPFVTGFSYLA